jgi:Mrp family chromosome partitioning ATPase
MHSPDGAEQPIVIGITSSHYGEGVSSVAANLALALAENRDYDRVLLVNANKGQASPHQLFGIKQAPGASEILMDAQGELIVMEQNLYKVPADISDATPSKGGPLARYQDNLLRLVKDRNYRYVVFDLPPLCEGSAIPLARMMDGVVLVVKAEGVRSEIVMRMKDLLQEVNVRVLGAVLNKRRFYIPGWLYNRL